MKHKITAKDWLNSAKVGMDPVSKRGGVSRGAYITNEHGCKYLTHAGEWTDGITGKHNWWDNQFEAACFLSDLKNKSRTARRARA